MSHYGSKIGWEWQVSLVLLLMGMSLVFLFLSSLPFWIVKICSFVISLLILFFSLFPVLETIVICYEAVRLYSKCGAQVDLILLLNMHDGKGDCPGYWILAHGWAGWGNYTCAWSCCKYFSECQRIERWCLADLNTLLYWRHKLSTVQTYCADV